MLIGTKKVQGLRFFEPRVTLELGVNLPRNVVALGAQLIHYNLGPVQYHAGGLGAWEALGFMLTGGQSFDPQEMREESLCCYLM